MDDAARQMIRLTATQRCFQLLAHGDEWKLFAVPSDPRSCAALWDLSDGEGNGGDKGLDEARAA